MDPLTVAAQFAAYTWYSECHCDTTPAEASAFARENWGAFLAHADVGLGRLLMRLGKVKRRKPAGKRRAVAAA
jgi:hypothetical protein